MGTSKMSNVMSHMVLGVGACYAFHFTQSVSREWRCVHFSFASMAINSALGVMCYVEPSLGGIYKTSYEIREQLFLGGLNADLYLTDHYEPRTLCYCHLLPGLVPIFGNKELGDVCLVANLVSNYFYCFNTGGDEYTFYSSFAATLAILLYFDKIPMNDVFSLEMADWENLTLAVFAMCAARAVTY